MNHMLYLSPLAPSFVAVLLLRTPITTTSPHTLSGREESWDSLTTRRPVPAHDAGFDAVRDDRDRLVAAGDIHSEWEGQQHQHPRTAKVDECHVPAKARGALRMERSVTNTMADGGR